MKSFTTVLVMLLCTLILSNCAGRKEFVALPTTLQRDIGHTEAYIEEPQQTMQANVENSHVSSYTGGGLIPALVDGMIVAYRKSCANDAMADLQKEFQAYGGSYQERFVQALKKTPWLHVQTVHNVKELTDETCEELLKKSTHDCVLIGKVDYRLNPTMNILKGTVYVTLYPTSDVMKKKAKTENPFQTPLLKFHVSATETLPCKGADKYANGKLWAQQNGLFLKQALDRIQDKVFIHLDQALANPNHVVEE